MKSKSADEMKRRLSAILTRDKVGVSDGFSSALNSDLNKLLNDYFELDRRCEIVITQEDGIYKLVLEAKASRIKSFSSTAELRRR